MSSHDLAAPRRVRIGLLDDHEVLLDAVTSWIHANAPDFELAVRARSWIEFVRDPGFPVDLVLMDFQLVEPVSIEARIRTCRAAGAKVIVISALDSSDARSRAAASGAIAFLSKSLPMREVMAAVRTALRLPEPAASGIPNPARTERLPFERPQLSPGERQALALYAAGRSTAEVADAMHVKYETAKTYLRRVREKYQRVGRPASRKVELIRRAAEDGILE
ncbi:response regulator [Rathayibacter sp. YIM 133350]|uniref:response regulator transcription factor n=1 Tax=Rathayibacter sp. YIM 133350 TaxID=3131992 RepID=UPI00307FCBEF